MLDSIREGKTNVLEIRYVTSRDMPLKEVQEHELHKPEENQNAKSPII